MSVIQVEKLCKSYGIHQVLHDVDLTVGAGKLVGFLGPNGSGKTTTIRILMGLLSAGSGSAQIFGADCSKNGKRLRREIGYLPGDVHFYPNMTGRATLRFFADARWKKADDEINRLAETFDLELDKKIVRKYSTGMRQKLGLIQALMHKPQLLILDEPTSALDPLVRKSVFQELKKVVQEGRTVLFSSHTLHEVEELCDEVVILRDGKIVEFQNIEVLRERALKRVEIKFANSSASLPAFPPQLQVVNQNNGQVSCTWSGEINELLHWLRELEIDDLTIERPDLNDLFITYYIHKGK